MMKIDKELNDTTWYDDNSIEYNVGEFVIDDEGIKYEVIFSYTLLRFMLDDVELCRMFEIDEFPIYKYDNY